MTKMEGNVLNFINSVYIYTTPDIILKGHRLDVFLLRLGTREGCLLSLLLFNMIGSSSQCNKARKGNK